ncbi:hypothetical protein, partial [Aeromonas veronii]|uniref:hypothetical protein n=1 Tax=Aeromonas veronii TaxID=654 RepID=UPI00406D123D
MHFANGYQTEWAMVIDEGDVPVKKRTEVRQGGLLFTKERLVPSGAVARSAGQAAVNADIAAHLQVELPVRKPSGKR